MTTDSPDRFRVLGEMESVSLAFAEDTKTEKKRRKKEKLPIMAINATEETKNDCCRRKKDINSSIIRRRFTFAMIGWIGFIDVKLKPILLIYDVSPSLDMGLLNLS